MKFDARTTMAAVTFCMLATAPMQTASAQSEKVIYSFQRGSDAQFPEAGLALLSGTFFGTAPLGGKDGVGAVFSVTPSGSESVIHSFAGDPDGRVPDASLLPVGSLLFGTTSGGGTASGGTVFSIKPSGAEKVRYNFATTSNYSPQASLVKAGALLYGTTKYASGTGYGSVFSISQTGAYKTLYVFKGGADGAYPLAPLVNFKGTLYGTTSEGGTYNCGIVFSITPAGKETVIYSFRGGADGSTPQSRLVALNGKLYGTTSVGGGKGLNPYFGTVYAITPGGAEKVVYAFGTNTNDGANPEAGLLVVNGLLYGTTIHGGAYVGGIVFSLTTAGVEHILYNFAGYVGDGYYPQGSLVNYDGSLYGVTMFGGSNDHGSVFAVTP
jgi:uncharacterized repeat protein (TIGR03803 family)